MNQQPQNLHNGRSGAQAQNGILKLGIDVHGDSLVVAGMYDAQLKPPQRFAPAAFAAWLAKQQMLGWNIVSCYEAGPFGFTLHRQLLGQGVTNYVIRPRNWDDEHRRIKTDRSDAAGMLTALDRYLAGNGRALCIVRVPTEQEERLRSQSRLRQSLSREARRLMLQAQGVARFHGFNLRGAWFGPRNWPEQQAQLPAWLSELVAPLRQNIIGFKKQEAELLAKMTDRSAFTHLPLGLGLQTAEEIEREICTWTRFKNRRQVAGFLGLTPSEFTSGDSRVQGAISKRGNGRVRWMLCEATWRLLRHQPRYRLVKKWLRRLLKQGRHAGRRKQIITAFAREFAIDWWRIRTGQTTPEKLGLKMVPCQ